MLVKQFGLNKSTSHFSLILFNFLFLIGLIFFSVITIDDATCSANWANISMYIWLISVVIHFLTVIIMKLKLTDLRFWFIAFMHVFMCGWFVLCFFFDDFSRMELIAIKTTSELIYTAMLYTLACIQAMFCGFFIGDEKSKKNIENTDKETPKNYRAIFYAGCILLCIGLPCRLYCDIRIMTNAQEAGSYTAIGSVEGLWDDFAIWFLPAIFLLMESMPNNKKMRNIISICSICYFGIVMISSGDRRYPTTAIIAIVLYLMSKRKRKMTFKQIALIIGLCFLALVLLNVFKLLRLSRMTDLQSFSDFFANNFASLFDFTDTIYETMYEFGVTLLSVVYVVEYIPAIQPFRYGATLLYSIVTLLPIGNMLPSTFRSMLISNNINGYEGSVGGSIIGDFYGNFGWFGIVGLLLFGLLIKYISNLDLKKMKSGLGPVYKYAIFYVLINAVRASIPEMFRTTIWMVAAIAIAYWVAKSLVKSKS